MAALSHLADDGRFELLELAGRGGMGEVFRARDRRDGRTVALKRLRPGRENQRAVRGRFAAEGDALAALAIAGIPRLIARGGPPYAPFIAMEWVDGIPLAELLMCERLGAARAVEIVLCLLEILAAMHAGGWVHGDVNAANVLVGADGSLKLIDLGLAQRPEPDDEPGMIEEVCGTPQFMAPELLRGAPPSVASDLYATGALLCCLLTGSCPVPGSTPLAVVDRLLDDAGPQLPACSCGDAALDAVLRRALARDPAARFASASEMRRALSLAGAGGGSRRTNCAAAFDVTQDMRVAS